MQLKPTHQPDPAQTARIALVSTIVNTLDNFGGVGERAYVYGICNAIAKATKFSLVDAALAGQLQAAVDATTTAADVAYLPTALLGHRYPSVTDATRTALRLMWLSYWAMTGTGLFGGAEWENSRVEAREYALVLLRTPGFYGPEHTVNEGILDAYPD